LSATVTVGTAADQWDVTTVVRRASARSVPTAPFMWA
jgi:hypothetical protein